jgi:SAM-dependent methyltransferase
MNASKAPLDNTQRFTGRVDAYRRYRSRYPVQIIPLLIERCGLAPASIVADIGAGTGMLSERFLENGNRVFAVEPNAEMRAACEELASQYPGLTCISGTAEETGLPDHAVDFIVIGRAFHWFDRSRCRPEFLRILCPQGWVMIAGLGQRRGSEPLELDYEAILHQYGIDYAAHRNRYAVGAAARQFLSGDVQKAEFPSVEELTYEALQGRMLSLSVTPRPDDPRFAPFEAALQAYFEKYQRNGTIHLPVNCKVYVGRLDCHLAAGAPPQTA